MKPWKVVQAHELLSWRNILAQEPNPRGGTIFPSYELVLASVIEELQFANSVLDLGCGPQPAIEKLDIAMAVAADTLAAEYARPRSIRYTRLVACAGERLPFKKQSVRLDNLRQCN